MKWKLPWAAEYPKILIRPSDKEEFSLNRKGTYSNKRMLEQFPKQLHPEWSYRHLIGLGFYAK